MFDLDETSPPPDEGDEHAEHPGVLTFVAIGPADMSLVTHAGKRALNNADLVVVDSDAASEQLAQSGIRYDARIEIVREDEADQLIAAVDAGQRVVRLSSGDFYDHHFREEILPAVLGRHRIRTHLIPGVSRWVSALTYGAVAPTNSFATLDASHEASQDWPVAETLVVWTTWDKVGRVAADGADRFGPDGHVLTLSNLGTTAQTSQLSTWRELTNGAAQGSGECYLIVGPGILEAERQRLDWFATKPLFNWSIVVPRTKDDLEELTDHLSLFGAVSEVVPTMAIEPPRTEQAMERGIRGLVDGRYLWLVFTSPNAVNAIFDRLAENGLDSRALSGTNLAAVGRGTTEALRRYGIFADLVPQDENTVAGLAREFPAFDDVIDPLNRVLVPTADVNVQPLVDGLAPLGWEVEEVAAYRTVRAAPPPAETRERIKSGLFDAVCFTSSTAVRNMIGIAGKPHAAMVVAAIGPATARACELHGLRVDVLAETPTFQALAEGLAKFAVRRSADQAARGMPPTRPSERKRRRRRALPDA